MAMKRLTQRICGLLIQERAEVTSAAALVLGELRESDDGIVEALGGCLANGHGVEVQCYVLEALEKIGSRAALPYVLPLLSGPDELRERAVRVVAGLGQPAVREIVQKLPDGSWSERRASLSVLARMRSASAVRGLLEGLAREPADHLEELFPIVRSELKAASAKERAGVRAAVESYLTSGQKPRSARESAVALRVLGFLDDAAAWPLVLRHARPTSESAVRLAALMALASIPRPARGGAGVSELVTYLADSDHDGVVRLTLRVLAPIPLAASHLDALRDLLLDARSMEVRRFALEKLGGIDHPRAVELLLDAVHAPEPELRDVAGRALSRIVSSPPALFERLVGETDAERAWRLARLVRSRPDALTRHHLMRLGDRLVRHLDHESRLYEPFVFLLADVAPEKAREVLLERARRKKRSRRFADTVLSLRILERHGLFDPEVRYELAVAMMKMTPSHEEPASSFDDPALALFQSLVGGEFALFDLLRHETLMTADDLTRIGAHVLSKSPAGQEIGRQILRLVMRKAPRSPLARDAKACLDRHGIR